MGQKPALPHRSIAVRFRPNKQTPTTGSMRRYVPEPALSKVRQKSTIKGWVNFHLMFVQL